MNVHERVDSKVAKMDGGTVTAVVRRRPCRELACVWRLDVIRFALLCSSCSPS